MPLIFSSLVHGLIPGNTVYVGLGFTGQPYSQPTRWIKSLTSIVAFILGSFLFSRLSTHLSPLRRSTLFLTSLIQALLTLLPCILLSAEVIPNNAGDLLPNNFIVLLPLSLLAVQAGGQCVLSRVLGYGEVPTVVLTSAYCDLAMDPKLFSRPSGSLKRNRRLGSMVLILLGAAAGGYLTRDGTVGKALWVVAIVKAIMAGVWVVWPGKKSVRMDD